MRVTLMNQRLKSNKNLSLYTQPTFNNMPVLSSRKYNQGMVYDHLTILQKIIESSLQVYPKVFVIRCDLRFPEGFPVEKTKGAMTRFNNALNYRIKRVGQRRTPSGRLPHKTDIRFFWCMEQNDSALPHYHYLLFLNADAFNNLGSFDLERDNMYSRIMTSWNSALGIAWNEQLVHFPSGGTFNLFRGQPYDDFFKYASYLCKVHSKNFSKESNTIGYSRI